MPPLGEACVCVPLVVTGLLLNCSHRDSVELFPISSAGGHRGPRGAVANEDLLWGPCKRTCQTGYLLFSLWLAFMVVHVVLLLVATRVSCFESCWTYLRILILW